MLWGLFFAVVLLAEKLIPGIGKLPNALKHLYVLLLTVLSFVLFNGESLTQVGADFAGMFGFEERPYFASNEGAEQAPAVQF